ncbi:tungsten cofactor oxidoreductase radical SAM maturase [Desulfurispora thermophila]|uniref:tungsten cofactor oxidoreductase radical SAM maturase n=1 Tax=Desulfurispora thermophila TaxID=265470 RepID=UPI00037B297B|nr:tungsten cofactor oxidoreductase radical SAM maturase [Desulfurispora thermophila]
MTKPGEPLSRVTFQAGRRVSLQDEQLQALGLPAGEKDFWLVPAAEGYRLLPVRPDVKKIYLEVTTRCNYDCITCIRHVWRDELSHMPAGTFAAVERSLDGLPELECVHFGGFGEPFTHPAIFDMMAAVKKRGLKVEAITNGSLLTPAVADRLIDLGVDMLFVSLDAPQEEEYQHIRPGGQLSGVLASMRDLLERRRQRGARRPELGVEFVAMRRNYHQLPELIKICHELRVQKVIVTNLLPYHPSMQDQILYDMDDTGVPFGDRSPLAMLMAQFPYMKLRTDRYCKFVEDRALCINHRGLVSPCYALMHSYSCFVYGRQKQIFPYYLGDVREQDLARIWQQAEYVNFRQAIRDFKFPSCTDCKYLDGCSMADSNEMDCWGNSPSCAECLWSRQLIACP